MARENKERRTKQALAAGTTLTVSNLPLNNCITGLLRRAEPHVTLSSLSPKTTALRLSSQQFGGHIQTTAASHLRKLSTHECRKGICVCCSWSPAPCPLTSIPPGTWCFINNINYYIHDASYVPSTAFLSSLVNPPL